jgi:iron complex outermembrane receptor protein
MNKAIFRSLLTAGAGMMAVTAATAVRAQDTAGTPPESAGASSEADGAYQLEEIVVTAQKREGDLQDTPVAISAFTGATLEERGIKDIANLQSYVPNLQIGQEQDGTKISLRGIGLQGTTSISDSGVAFYIDNFYVGRPAGGSAVFFDIDRIEVLRGPQGTLYGRNATGGVVNVISKQPSTARFEGLVGASYGSRDFFEGRGMLNIPLTDIAALRVSAVYSQEDGYIRNLSTVPGTKNGFGSDGDYSIRGQLLVGTPEQIEVLLFGNYSKQNGTGVTMSYLERRIGGAPPVQALLRTIPADDPDPLVTNNNFPGYLDIETTTSWVKLTKDLGGVEAVIQGGKMWQTSDLVQDFDGSAVDVGQFRKYQTSDATSLEARLASTGGGPFSWIVGGYYFKEDVYIIRQVLLNGLAPGGVRITLPPFLLDEYGTSRTVAVFGSATYAIIPEFRVTAGARYTDDHKAGRKVTRANFGQPFPPDIPNAQFSGITSFDKINWKVGLEWDAAPDTLVYASVSTGYKAGGFNISSDASPYDHENITAYEVGIKSDFWDRRARVNVDAFYYDYTDMQLTTLGTFGPSNAPGQFTVNAGKARIYGIELDTQFKVTPDLLLMASYAYTDAKFTELFNADPRNNVRRDLSSNRVPYVARHALNLGARYTVDLSGAGTLTFSANHGWHSKKFLREFNDRVIDLVPANGKTDLTVTFDMEGTGLKLTGYVTNLENDIERNNIYVSPGFIGSSAVTSYTKPRTFGVRADWRF